MFTQKTCQIRISPINCRIENRLIVNIPIAAGAGHEETHFKTKKNLAQLQLSSDILQILEQRC